MAVAVARRSLKPDTYYENGVRMIYVVGCHGADYEVEDCRTLERWIARARELRGWTEVRRSG